MFETASRWNARSCADWKRSSGFFSRQCRTIRSRPASRALAARAPAGPPSGSRSWSRPRIRRGRRGCPPASRRARRRTRRCRSGASAGCARDLLGRHVADACPGWSRLGGVGDRRRLGARPPRRPGCVSWARPKSRIFTRPSRVTKMFSGLRSRWTMPFSWAAARPWAVWIAYSTALRARHRPPLEPRPQRLALQQLGDHVRAPVLAADVVDRPGCSDGSARRPRAPPARSAAGARGRREVWRQHLERHVALEARVASAVDLAHAPGADQRTIS